MSVKAFLEKVKESPKQIEFNELMDLIEKHYSFTETAFVNGDLKNEAGENSGSCKLFAFAQLQGLDQAQTLACFGTYYREDVLKDPTGNNHQNIRNFMRTGWDGIGFKGVALTGL